MWSYSVYLMGAELSTNERKIQVIQHSIPHRNTEFITAVVLMLYIKQNLVI